MGTSEPPERAHTRSLNPVKWLANRDRTLLNNFGLALMALGGGGAVAFVAAKFATPGIPWWLIILGLVILFIGLILALSTIGKKQEGGTVSVAISPPSTAGPPRPGLPPRDEREVTDAMEDIKSYPTKASENINYGNLQDEDKSAGHTPSAGI